MSETVTINRLGAGGDGVADVGGGHVFVPFTLPGETVSIAREGDRGMVMALKTVSPDRVEAACRHFEDCGGCALQHMDMAAYRDWKRQRVIDALATRGLEAEVGRLVPAAPATRRRAAFTARRDGESVLLGHNAAMSHRVVDIAECPILLPSIVDALQALRRLAALLVDGSKPFRLAVTATLSGLDIDAQGCGVLKEKNRAAVTRAVVEAGFARLSIDGEVILAPKPPQMQFGPVTVTLPPAPFLQATAEAEAAMAGLVSAHMAKAKRVADLFCGAGTFTFALANKAAVHAVESDRPALAALDRASRHTQGLKPVTTEARDLFRRPLTAKELDSFQGAVFDPPRAGAEAQARQIAASKLRRVAAVSCNPATLARDLRILVDGGYRIESITPVDQFLWSPHVEAVALLSR